MADNYLEKKMEDYKAKPASPQRTDRAFRSS